MDGTNPKVNENQTKSGIEGESQEEECNRENVSTDGTSEALTCVRTGDKQELLFVNDPSEKDVNGDTLCHVFLHQWDEHKARDVTAVVLPEKVSDSGVRQAPNSSLKLPVDKNQMIISSTSNSGKRNCEMIRIDGPEVPSSHKGDKGSVNGSPDDSDVNLLSMNMPETSTVCDSTDSQLLASDMSIIDLPISQLITTNELGEKTYPYIVLEIADDNDHVPSSSTGGVNMPNLSTLDGMKNSSFQKPVKLLSVTRVPVPVPLPVIQLVSSCAPGTRTQIPCVPPAVSVPASVPKPSNGSLVPGNFVFSPSNNLPPSGITTCNGDLVSVSPVPNMPFKPLPGLEASTAKNVKIVPKKLVPSDASSYHFFAPKRVDSLGTKSIDNSNSVVTESYNPRANSSVTSAMLNTLKSQLPEPVVSLTKGLQNSQPIMAHEAAGSATVNKRLLNENNTTQTWTSSEASTSKGHAGYLDDQLNDHPWTAPYLHSMRERRPRPNSEQSDISSHSQDLSGSKGHAGYLEDQLNDHPWIAPYLHLMRERRPRPNSEKSDITCHSQDLSGSKGHAGYVEEQLNDHPWIAPHLHTMRVKRPRPNSEKSDITSHSQDLSGRKGHAGYVEEQLNDHPWIASHLHSMRERRPRPNSEKSDIRSHSQGLSGSKGHAGYVEEQLNDRPWIAPHLHSMKERRSRCNSEKSDITSYSQCSSGRVSRQSRISSETESARELKHYMSPETLYQPLPKMKRAEAQSPGFHSFKQPFSPVPSFRKESIGSSSSAFRRVHSPQNSSRCSSSDFHLRNNSRSPSSGIGTREPPPDEQTLTINHDFDALDIFFLSTSLMIKPLPQKKIARLKSAISETVIKGVMEERLERQQRSPSQCSSRASSCASSIFK